jgi:hypothetical protein
VLFDGRLRSLVAELLDVRRDRDCFDLVKFEAVLVSTLPSTASEGTLPRGFIFK